VDHTARCQLLIYTFKNLGYDYTDNGQRRIFTGKSLDPDDCNQGYIFSPTEIDARNYQMFRGYVHDTQDIVYLRVNVPGLPYGLGQPPLVISLAEFDGPDHFTKKINDFCHRTSVSTAVIEQLISEHCLRTRGTKKIETIKCSGFGACEGSGKRTFRAGAAGSYQDDCKVCGGKGTRRQVTERYYLSNSGED